LEAAAQCGLHGNGLLIELAVVNCTVTTRFEANRPVAGSKLDEFLLLASVSPAAPDDGINIEKYAILVGELLMRTARWAVGGMKYQLENESRWAANISCLPETVRYP
jgi:hypothetical protein